METSTPMKTTNHTTDTQSAEKEFTTSGIENSQPVQKQQASVTRHSLYCPLCRKRFRSPVRKLNCTHSFCETCLETFTADIKCPTCKEKTPLPVGGICKLQSDYNINSQIDDPNNSWTKDTTDIDDDREDVDYVSTFTVYLLAHWLEHCFLFFLLWVLG